jgi:ABC-type multidrug transport system permease subunit
MTFSLKRFIAVFSARNKEFWRDRAALSWNLAFPLLLIVGFSVIFSGENKHELKIGLLEVQQIPEPLKAIKYTEFVNYSNQKEALSKVAHHQIDLLLNWNDRSYWVNPTSAKGYLAENLLTNYLPGIQKRTISGDAIRYVDWVIPGILGMNIMFSCLFGVGYVIVRYRKNGVLKRLHATPVTAFEFLAAQIASRFLIVVTLSAAIFLATWAMVGFKVEGSLLSLLLILVLGTLSMIALGLLMASRSESEELTGGLLNFASWPMMFLSGVWFSLEGAPSWLHSIAQLLPLTHFVDAARSIMTEGASLTAVSYHLMALGIMTIVFFTLGGWMFNWGKAR